MTSLKERASEAAWASGECASIFDASTSLSKADSKESAIVLTRKLKDALASSTSCSDEVSIVEDYAFSVIASSRNKWDF